MKNEFKIDKTIALAPIAGFSDKPFRRICVEQGVDFVVTELISADALIRGSRKTLEYLEFDDNERPLAIQIFGNSPDVLADGAQFVEEYKPDIIDINLGCPAQKVNKSGSGAALLKDPEKIRAIMDRVVNSVAVPVSAKIRLGWDDKTKNYIDVLHALEDGGVSFVAVHGRTRAQGYSGSANWDDIGRIVEAASVPIFGNGDIISHDDAMEKMNRYGCQGVMIGRGAIGNPWIFSDKVPSLRERIDMVVYHLDLMMEHYPQSGLIQMRKHIVKYINGIRGASKARGSLMLAIRREEIVEILENLFHIEKS